MVNFRVITHCPIFRSKRFSTISSFPSVFSCTHQLERILVPYQQSDLNSISDQGLGLSNASASSALKSAHHVLPIQPPFHVLGSLLIPGMHGILFDVAGVRSQ